MKENVIKRKVILLQAGVNATQIARAIGLTPQAIHNEINKPGPSRRVREALCEATKTTPAEFWPELQGETNDPAQQGNSGRS